MRKPKKLVHKLTWNAEHDCMYKQWWYRICDALAVAPDNDIRHVLEKIARIRGMAYAKPTSRKKDNTGYTALEKAEGKTLLKCGHYESEE
jgi:hypothetical protein